MELSSFDTTTDPEVAFDRVEKCVCFERAFFPTRAYAASLQRAPLVRLNSGVGA